MAYARSQVALVSRRFSVQTALGWLVAACIGAVIGAIASTALRAMDVPAGSNPTGEAGGATSGSWWRGATNAPALCAAQSDASTTAQPSLAPSDAHADATPQSLLDKLIHPSPAAAERSTDTADAQRLMALAHNDPALRQQLMARYTTEADANARSRLASVLIAAATPDIVRFASSMLGQRDADQRQQGLAILASVQLQQPEARQALLGALDTETDPRTLGMVVQSLVPGENRSPQETQAMLDKLAQMARRSEPEVRAAALSTMAQWGGPASENSIVQALADPNESVIESAIDALGQLGTRGNPANDALLNLAEREDVAPSLRQQAVSALNRANLDTARYERLERLRKDPRLTG